MRYFLFLLILLSPNPVVADTAAQIKTGIFTTVFDQRSQLSNPEAMVEITHWPKDKIADYALKDHTFQMVVPEEYDGSEAFGLLVFIHPNSTIDTDRFYGRVIKDVLAKHKLIWVSYDKAGNDIAPNVRLGLALDAVHNVTQQYRIDENHIYASGLSGGGRMTCMAGIYYPQVFTGAVPIVGTLYFRDVQLPENPELRALIKPDPPEGVVAWPRGLLKPLASTLRQMKKEQRWVLLAGETDYNMPQMRAHYEQGFKHDGFEQAHYLEVKGMGHTYPEANWYDKALEILRQGDQKTDDKADEPADERTQRNAQRRLEVALRTLSRDHDRGVRALERLIEDMPDTDAATKAGEKLRSLEKQ